MFTGRLGVYIIHTAEADSPRTHNRSSVCWEEWKFGINFGAKAFSFNTFLENVKPKSITEAQ